MMVRPRRSALYLPGSNRRALDKAKTLDADVLIFDLEDAVAPEEKAAARERVTAAVASGAYGERELVVRINGLSTQWGLADVAGLAAALPDALLVPKVQSPEDLRCAAEAMRKAGGAGSDDRCAIWAMIETPRSIVDLGAIARVAEDPNIPLTCFVAGTNDLVKDTRASLDQERTSALFWLSSMVTAARAFGLDVLDGVYNNFRDTQGFEAECRHGRMLGMDGKTVIHPGQVETANAVFAPSAEDVSHARAILAAFKRPENHGKAVITLNGEMVERLHAEMAQRTVAIADALGL